MDVASDNALSKNAAAVAEITANLKAAARSCGSMRHLWLFDIDGTLVNINHVHLKAYKLDYREVLNRGVPDGIIVATFGMSERETHESILRQLGIPADETLIGRLAQGYVRNVQKAIETTRITPLEGAVPFLSALKERSEHLGIITGNLEKPARRILEKAGLASFFTLFSSDDGTLGRKEIVLNAIRQAEERGLSFEAVVVVGDTTKDVKAAQGAAKERTELRIVSVAVATGSDGVATLEKAGAGVVVRSLTELRDDALLGVLQKTI